ncbi:magnesium/cobalt transporter CorA [Pseudalkalibacillus berkeleyi]|uniref:Magnesium transport protein CorA n=1 Tax=Pseudalkalibacillus berkeleyi TaxID=1069813 RepID=A0ABS9GZJ6_9BACL|nr:magnesium/cobalt transporter CorA [Pseudalkalibacillus berkeleyi]MCF6136913.1 magnesium/cobalt transporter CorA [Pseudalkalibacillus berkeleyi]
MGIEQDLERKKGLPPGSLVYVGDEVASSTKISVIDYIGDDLVEKELDKIQDVYPYTKTNSVTWVNIEGLNDIDVFKEIRDEFGIHPLLIEDILNTEHRPKINILNDYVVMILKMVWFNKEEVEIEEEQISVIIKDQTIFTIQEKEGDVLDSVRKAIRQNLGKIRNMSAGYLVYSILDAIVDQYLFESERISSDIEQLEEDMVIDPDQTVLQQIYHYKNIGMHLRKLVWPVKEIIGGLEKSKVIDMNTGFYLKDVSDHIIHVMDTVEMTRSMAANLLDVYFSSVSNKMNEVMKVLTIVSTIFIPLTFIAGIYGMNFAHMPELDEAWAYPVVWGIMIAMTLGMILFFKRKKWF